MRAFRFYKPNVPWELEAIPRPTVGADEVLVKIRASGICGTDLHYRHGRMLPERVPITLGHEAAGVIEEVGERVGELVVGDRVCIHYILSCGNCVHCSQGNDNRCRSLGIKTSTYYIEAKTRTGQTFQKRLSYRTDKNRLLKALDDLGIPHRE